MSALRFDRYGLPGSEQYTTVYKNGFCVGDIKLDAEGGLVFVLEAISDAALTAADLREIADQADALNEGRG